MKQEDRIFKGMKEVVILLLLVTAPVFQSCRNPENRNDSVMENRMEYTPQTNEVEVMLLERGEFHKQIISNGKLCAWAKSALYFPESGTVEKVYVENGQRVNKGEVLVKLDDTEKKATLEQAEMEFEKAGLNFLDELAGMGYYSSDTLNVPQDIMRLAKIRSGYISAKSNLDKARRSLEAMKVRAPFGGVVADLQIKEWDRTGSSSLCTIIDCSSFDATFTVLESEYRLLEKGQSVTITPFGESARAFRGRVVSINPTIDGNGQISVTARVPGNGSLLDGMNVNAIVERSVPDRFVVPKSAVVMRDNMEVLFRYVNGKAEWVYVNILDANSTSYAVEGNIGRGDKLLEGDLIIISGNLNLADDSDVALKK